MRGRFVVALLGAVGAVLAVIGVVATPTASAAPAPRTQVVIVSGTFVPPQMNEVLASRLRRDGYQVTNLTLPTLGIQDMNLTAQSLARSVRQITRRTGATRVDLIGHSQGGLIARRYVQAYGGDRMVRDLVMLGTPNHGLALSSAIATVGGGRCPGFDACTQAIPGSPFLRQLNSGDVTVGDVRYTTITSRYDEFVDPRNGALGGGAVNVVVQQQCPQHLVEHATLIFDPTVYSGVRQALRGQPIRLDCRAA